MFASEKSRFGSFYSVKTAYLAIFLLFQKARYWIENFITCQNLNWKKYNALDFELKFFDMLDFEKNVCIQKITFWFFLLRENGIFRNFLAFSKSKLLNWKFHYVSEFELKKIQRVRFWVKPLTTCQILNELLEHASDFECDNLQRVRFLVYFFCRLSIFHAFNITGHVSAMF